MSIMLEEIRQQPGILARLVDRPPAGIRRLRARFSSSRPILAVIVARGTSDNAAVFGRYLLEITAGIPASLAAPSVSTLYGTGWPCREALVVAISQSGESTDINCCVASARAAGAFTVAITNEGSSTLAGLADEVLLTPAGTERSVAATKTYTAQMMVLYQLASALGGGIGPDDLQHLPDAVDRQLQLESRIRDLAREHSQMSRAVVLSRGFNYGNGLEFALKLMETSYLMAIAFSAADFAHGPIAVADRETPVFAFALPGPTLDELTKLLKRLHSSHVKLLCIGSPRACRGLPGIRWIDLGQLPGAPAGLAADVLSPIPSIIPAQLFAAHLATSKGLDPDRPRRLSKVTKTL